ncbi:MAG: S1 RNA-binding domain-containing protein, partial [Salinivirgaceae bacterium]|nr:S1 RNA-binding domain-containing protein [Salinivirgaceae bacterium]
WDALDPNLKVGDKVHGKVVVMADYGAFIEIAPGVEGLIHVSEMSWSAHLHSAQEFMKVGDKVKGKVVVMADYGAFVEIAPGVEGLIHVSEMSWSQHLRSANEFLNVGDEVEAVILTLDREERKMSLGMKQLKPDPWEKIADQYAVGTKHTAKVRNFTTFGVFVEIEEGVDGLIHISDLSWTKKIKHPAEFTTIGADIDVVVLEIDKENRRLRLGHKQLEENPWDVFETLFTVDSIHEGTIIELTEKGAVVALPYGVEGFATPKHLVKEDGTQAKLDEKLDFKVIEFNKEGRKIIVSHSRIFEDAKRGEEKSKKDSAAKATKKATKKIADSIEKTTLGDIAELAALKDEMAQAEKPKAAKKAKKDDAAEEK